LAVPDEEECAPSQGMCAPGTWLLALMHEVLCWLQVSRA
jgi:hypothetical protein